MTETEPLKLASDFAVADLEIWRQLVDKALSLNPEHPQALDLAGSAAWEGGEFALAARHWKRLLAQIPEGNPRAW